jgi:hypothetical protein
LAIPAILAIAPISSTSANPKMFSICYHARSGLGQQAENPTEFLLVKFIISFFIRFSH